jgi:predicted TIM-barrel enzyme
MEMGIMTNPLFQLDPLVIAALHLPPFLRGRRNDPAELEDYLLQNLEVFARGGIPAVIIQDETPVSGPAYPETIALMASLVRLARREFPQIQYGVIIETHDAIAPLAVAAACGASFVRIKVYVGAMLKSTGVQQGCGADAAAYRHLLRREDIAILADVYDRTGFPVGGAPLEQAERWAVQLGADALVLTGSTFDESLQMLGAARQQKLGRPLILGGSVTAENAVQSFAAADGVVVSSALKRTPAGPQDLIYWDAAKVEVFMEKARLARSSY